MSTKKTTTKRKPKPKACPSPKGSNGRADRDGGGRFVKGHGIPGPGNPMGAKVHAWREALADAVSPEDITDVVAVLLLKAKCGEPWAVIELLNRTIGKPVPHVDPDADHDAIGAELIEHLRRAHESLGLGFDERN